MNNKLEVIGIDHGWSMMKTISQLTNFSSVLISTPLKVNSIHYLPAFYTAHAM